MARRSSHTGKPLWRRIVEWPILRNKGMVIVLLIAFIWISVAVGNEWKRRRQIEREITALQEEITRIEESSKTLEEALTALRRSETIEREARRRLNLVRPGESVVVVPESDALGDAHVEESSLENTTVTAQSGTGPIANVLAWWEYFFGQQTQYGE